jgi:RNase P/RNase MRP subunit p30
MKTVFADLHVCIKFTGRDQISRVVEKLSRLGYGLIAVPSRRFPEESVLQAKECCASAGVDFASRVDLLPRTAEELLASLRKLRRKFEIIAVACESKNVARQAAKDRRVDLVSFPKPDYRNAIFDAAEAELASRSNVSLEIETNPLLTLEGPQRARLLSNLRRQVTTALDQHVPVVVSSGVSEEFLLRGPKDVAALASLFDLTRTYALEAVSKNPTRIVKANRRKLESKFVAPGIRIVRRGKRL